MHLYGHPLSEPQLGRHRPHPNRPCRRHHRPADVCRDQARKRLLPLEREIERQRAWPVIEKMNGNRLLEIRNGPRNHIRSRTV